MERPAISSALAENGVCVSQKRDARLMMLRGRIERCKRRFKMTTTPNPAATSLAPDLIKRIFLPEPARSIRLVQRHRVHPDLGELAVPRFGHRPRQSPGGRLRHGRAHADRAGRRARDGHRAAPARTRADLPHRPRVAIHLGKFTQLLTHTNIIPSLRDPDRCWDNSVAESWFATLKEELIYRQAWPTRTLAEPSSSSSRVPDEVAGSIPASPTTNLVIAPGSRVEPAPRRPTNRAVSTVDGLSGPNLASGKPAAQRGGAGVPCGRPARCNPRRRCLRSHVPTRSGAS